MNGCIYRTKDGECDLYSEGGKYHAFCVGDEPCEGRKPSNADRIRGMSDEELSIALCRCGCPPTAWDEHGVLDCPKPNEEVCEEVCGSCWLDWLKQEAE